MDFRPFNATPATALFERDRRRSSITTAWTPRRGGEAIAAIFCRDKPPRQSGLSLKREEVEARA
jgi:hypothetical protein